MIVTIERSGEQPESYETERTIILIDNGDGILSNIYLSHVSAHDILCFIDSLNKIQSALFRRLELEEEEAAENDD